MDKKTPLYDIHLESGAKMVPFAGFSMPVQYAGIKKEHEAVRTAAGLFDVSHMGNVLVTGEDSLKYLQNLTVNDVSKLGILDVQYSAMCYENGGVVDDILVTCVEENAYHIVINAANIKKDLEWMEQHLTGDVQLKNQSEELCILALQGPKALEIAQLICSQNLEELKPFSCGVLPVNDVNMVYSRTGYTGEDGLEFFPKNADAPALWARLMEVGEPLGLLPIGLGARDTLRLEAGYTLYGHEVNESLNLVEGGLSWIINWDKPEFIGKESLFSLKSNGLKQKVVGIEMLDKGIPREGYPIHSDGKEVGYITSGTLSPHSGKGIALGYVKFDQAVMGNEVDVMVRDKPKKARIVSRYFYKRPKEKSAG